MQYLQEIFNNREIAIGFWIIVLFVFLLLLKVGRSSLKNVLFCMLRKNIIIAFVIFIIYYCGAIYILYRVGFWDLNLLKDTIFWFFFAEIPLLFQALEKGKDKYFFIRTIKNNLALIVILEFLLNIWTFSLGIELVIVPVFVVVGIIYALADRSKEYKSLKKACDIINYVFGLIVFGTFIGHVFNDSSELFNLQTLQGFLFPILILLLNLPLIYGFSLYNLYEQIFVRVKNNKFKNKINIIKFARFSLPKVHAVRTDPDVIMKIIKQEDTDLKEDLERIKKRLDFKIGDHYMKRSNFYITSSIVLAGCFISGINFFNDQFIIHMCAFGLILSIFFLVYSIGLRMRKNEELNMVKKYALINFLYLIKKQYKNLEEFPPIDNPDKLFLYYLETVYDLKEEYDKNVMLLENLLTSFEWGVASNLNNSLYPCIAEIGIAEKDFRDYSVAEFSEYYQNKRSESQQTDDWNLFEMNMKKYIEKYSENIENCYLEFKRYID